MSRGKRFVWHWELSVCLFLAFLGFGVFWAERLSLQHVQVQLREEVLVSVRHVGVELGNSLSEETMDKVNPAFEHLLEFDRNLTFLELLDQDQRVILKSRQRYFQGEVNFEIPFLELYQFRVGISDLPLRKIKEQYRPFLGIDLLLLAVFMISRRIQGGLRIRTWFVTKNSSHDKKTEQALQAYTYSWNKMERERSVLATNLHEQIGQSLSAVLMRLGMIPKRSSTIQPGDPGEAVEDYREAQSILRESISEITELTERLRPSVLDTLGIWTALRSYIRWFESQAGVWVEFSALGAQDMRFPSEIEILIFRIAQEGLENIRRHAQAGLVELTFCVCERDLAIQIKDDGVGIEPQQLANFEESTGGLSELKNRLRYYQGSLEITSILGQGTIVKAHIPMSCAIKRRDEIEPDSCFIGG